MKTNDILFQLFANGRKPGPQTEEDKLRGRGGDHQEVERRHLEQIRRPRLKLSVTRDDFGLFF